MRTRRSFAAALAGLAVLAAGCTVEDPSTNTEAGSGSIKPIEGLDAETVKVGSKEFDEQLVLGHIAILTLQAAGAKTEDNTNITGSDNVRRSLENKKIDLYWEYTGTAWVSYLKQDKQVNDPDALFDEVAKMDAENGITWWAQAPANNTYAIAANAEAAKKHSIKTISDYAELAKSNPQEAATCMGPEFSSRDDGFPGVQKKYDFELPRAQRHQVSDAIVYTEAGKGETCNFGSVAATDGRIPAQNLVVLEDDKKFFPVYSPAISIRSELAEKHPELEETFSAVAEKLTDEVLLSLNKKVSVDAQDPKKVATEWMTDEGFIS